MDVEGSEWNSLRHMMDNNLLRDILQIGIEIHISGFIELPPDEVRVLVIIFIFIKCDCRKDIQYRLDV